MSRTLHSGAARAALFLILALSVGACSTINSTTSRVATAITPFKIDIVQGNVVTSEQYARIKVGMTRAQVRDILGSPMITDIFHTYRWDYMFTIVRPGTEPQRRSVVAIFEGDILKSIDAPELPTEHEFVASITRNRNAAAPRVLELTEEQRKALPVPPRREPVPVPETGPLRAYPPLEAQ
jgi:outer membrane protein assembly factor BamE